MRTDDLIADLALSPSPHARPALRVATSMLAGWLVALLGLVLVLGPPLAAVPTDGHAAVRRENRVHANLRRRIGICSDGRRPSRAEACIEGGRSLPRRLSSCSPLRHWS